MRDIREIVCSREQLAQLKTDQGFQRVVALTRLVNQLRFAQMVLPGIKDDDTPSGRRQRINSFLLVGALLHEGMQLVQRLAQNFRYRDSFQSGFGKLLRDKTVAELISKHLKPLRDQAVFHTDDKDIENRLHSYSADPVIFMSGQGSKSGHTYYDLGDILAMIVLIGAVQSQQEFMTRSREIMKRTTDLAIQFLNSSDRLIADLAREYKLTIRSQNTFKDD